MDHPASASLDELGQALPPSTSLRTPKPDLLLVTLNMPPEVRPGDPVMLAVGPEVPFEQVQPLLAEFGPRRLSATERNVVLLAASRANGCRYCVAVHSTVADMQRDDPELRPPSEKTVRSPTPASRRCGA